MIIDERQSLGELGQLLPASSWLRLHQDRRARMTPAQRAAEADLLKESQAKLLERKSFEAACIAKGFQYRGAPPASVGGRISDNPNWTSSCPIGQRWVFRSNSPGDDCGKWTCEPVTGLDVVRWGTGLDKYRKDKYVLPDEILISFKGQKSRLTNRSRSSQLTILQEFEKLKRANPVLNLSIASPAPDFSALNQQPEGAKLRVKTSDAKLATQVLTPAGTGTTNRHLTDASEPIKNLERVLASAQQVYKAIANYIVGEKAPLPPSSMTPDWVEAVNLRSQTFSNRNQRPDISCKRNQMWKWIPLTRMLGETEGRWSCEPIGSPPPPPKVISSDRQEALDEMLVKLREENLVDTSEPQEGEVIKGDVVVTGKDTIAPAALLEEEETVSEEEVKEAIKKKDEEESYLPHIIGGSALALLLTGVIVYMVVKK